MFGQPVATGVFVSAGVQDQRDAVGFMAGDRRGRAAPRGRTAKYLSRSLERLIEDTAVVPSSTKHSNECRFRSRGTGYPIPAKIFTPGRDNRIAVDELARMRPPR